MRLFSFPFFLLLVFSLFLFLRLRFFLRHDVVDGWHDWNEERWMNWAGTDKRGLGLGEFANMDRITILISICGLKHSPCFVLFFYLLSFDSTFLAAVFLPSLLLLFGWDNVDGLGMDGMGWMGWHGTEIMGLFASLKYGEGFRNLEICFFLLLFLKWPACFVCTLHVFLGWSGLMDFVV